MGTHSFQAPENVMRGRLISLWSLQVVLGGIKDVEIGDRARTVGLPRSPAKLRSSPLRQPRVRSVSRALSPQDERPVWNRIS